jgi:hypothetical protein
MKTSWIVVGALCASTMVLAEPQRKAAARAPRVSTAADCAAALGAGVKSARRFCDVIISDKPADSVAIKVPPRRGAAKLLFDLHHRVAVPPDGMSPEQAFAASTAIVAVVGPKGPIGRAAAVSEFRTVADLFDRIGGGPNGGPKIVAPGPATPVSVTIPAGTVSIGIVGVRLEVLNRLGRQSFETPGRPVAIVSNIRVEYTPVR